MPREFNHTTTRAKGWQKDCWEWSKAKVPFELHDVGTRHLVFCEILSRTYRGNYQLSTVMPVATFTFGRQRTKDS